MTVDYPDFATPQAHATAIASTGAPLLHGVNPLAQALAVAAPVGGFPTQDFVIAKPGYVAQIKAVSAGQPTVPFLRVSLFWDDTPVGPNRTAVEAWIIPVTNSGGSTVRVFGKGPTKGGFLQMQFQNHDPALAATVTLTLIETTQHIARDDWRSDPIASVGTFVAPGGDPFANLLAGEAGQSIPASGSHQRLLPLYCGQVAFNLLQNAAVSLETTLTAQDPNAGNTIIYQNNGSTALTQGPLIVNLPRCPVLLNLGNLGTVATNLSWAMVPVEYAS